MIMTLTRTIEIYSLELESFWTASSRKATCLPRSCLAHFHSAFYFLFGNVLNLIILLIGFFCHYHFFVYPVLLVFLEAPRKGFWWSYRGWKADGIRRFQNHCFRMKALKENSLGWRCLTALSAFLETAVRARLTNERREGTILTKAWKGSAAAGTVNCYCVTCFNSPHCSLVWGKKGS